MAFAVFWGTMFPLISEAVKGVKITVGPPFFNQVNIPIGLILLFLVGAGPILSWRRASKQNFLKHFLRPFSIGIAGAILFYTLGMDHFYALVSSFLCIFVLVTIIEEFYRGIKVRHSKGENWFFAFTTLISNNRRRYGGYIVHLGIVFAFITFTGQAFQVEDQQALNPGESMVIKDYTLTYEKMTFKNTPHMDIVTAHLMIFKNGKHIDTLTPEKKFHKTTKGKDQPETEVAIRSTLKEDLYVVLAGYNEQQLATFKVYVNPLVTFLWLGGLIMAVGTLIALWPEKRLSRKKQTAYSPTKKKEEQHV